MIYRDSKVCSSSCAFNFPSLEKVAVREYPTIKFFAHEVVATQKLWQIQTGEHKYEWEWEWNQRPQ